jgi:HK97 family phage portal protein
MKLWPFETKNLPTRNSGTVLISGGSGWTRSENYITEGYQLNAVVYRCVREIVDSCANISIELHQGDAILETHPTLELLKAPNPMQGYDDFIKNIFTDFMTTGEMTVYGSSEDRPVELWPLNPTEIEVEPGNGRIPKAYVHKVNGRKTTIPVDPMTARSQLFMMKMYNPSNHWRGQSPLMAAGLAGDTHNAGSKWNYKLLKNSARPSGIVKFKDGDPDTNTISRLVEYFKYRIQGEENAGDLPILTGGAEWQPVDNSPRDMDFHNTMQEMTKLIALAFGIPLPLISNDASTFNNMENARERLYTDTIIPIFNAFLDSFGKWLLPAYGESLSFKINMDDIPALEGARARKYDRAIKAKQAGVLTVDEVRVEIGYDELGGAAAELDPLGSLFQTNTEQRNRDMAALAYGTKAAD